MMDVLIADDDENVRESVAAALNDAGHEVTTAADGAQVLGLLAKRAFDLAICDVQMPNVDGLTLLRRIRREAPRTAVVIMTSFGRIPDVVDCLRDGAVDYVTKPFDPESFARAVVAPIAERRAIRKKVEQARAQLVARATGAALIAESRAMRSLVDRMATLANSDASVLIVGERGSGKELVARAMHAQSARRDGPLVLLDGATLPDAIAAREYREIDGDGSSRDAWFAQAMGGTLVLDGIERLPLIAQARLLRAIDSPTGRARRSGDWEPHGVRLITLSRESLGERVASGDMLQSLFYRLNGVQLHVPSLRARGDDLFALVTELLTELTPPGRTAPTVTPAAWAALGAYSYPGNVRELRWVLEHAAAMADGSPIDAAHLPAELTAPA